MSRFRPSDGSLANVVSHTATAEVPHAGMPATLMAWSDRYAYDVAEVSPSGKSIKIRACHAIAQHTDFTEKQDWLIMPNPDGDLLTARLAGDGRYYTEGGMRRGQRVALGYHSHYIDPTF